MMTQSNKGHYDEDEDEEMNKTHKSSTIAHQIEKKMPEIPLCGFLSVQYYQPYFDVETSDITSRISYAMFYCKKDTFLQHIKDRPDAYGPLWIATTLIFTVAVTSHINSWIKSYISGKNWYSNNLSKDAVTFYTVLLTFLII
mmetsp:Transcript_28293/g.27128  ORF Transcript_28293/g.27128 Transcript_28293/m.27128 type:complete len:142 (-) Transcript_28293:95-520(-)